jgi:hypothetical protein
MKEDYLWDKTGDDAEIQGLENALKAFRYQETAPPELPQRVFTLEAPKRGKFFQFRLALAVFAPVVLVLLLAWFQFVSRQHPAVENAAQTSAPQTSAPTTAEEKFAKQSEILPVVEIQQPRAVKRKAVRAFQRNAPKPRLIRTVLRTDAPKEPAETLTAEEKYAYRQLMLALSITGTQLKIVKDKINGLEEQNAVIDSAK